MGGFLEMGTSFLRPPSLPVPLLSLPFVERQMLMRTFCMQANSRPRDFAMEWVLYGFSLRTSILSFIADLRPAHSYALHLLSAVFAVGINTSYLYTRLYSFATCGADEMPTTDLASSAFARKRSCSQPTPSRPRSLSDSSISNGSSNLGYSISLADRMPLPSRSESPPTRGIIRSSAVPRPMPLIPFWLFRASAS
jgi:hypothetical protein